MNESEPLLSECDGTERPEKAKSSHSSIIINGGFYFYLNVLLYPLSTISKNIRKDANIESIPTVSILSNEYDST